MKTLLTAGVAAATLLAPLTLLTAATATAPTTTLRPAQIERGPNPKIPHVDGTTVVDGSRRIRVNADFVALVGKSGTDSYIVHASNDDGSNVRLLRVSTRARKVLARGEHAWETELSADGKRIASVAHSGNGRSSTVRVISAKTGAVLHRGWFAGTVSLLEFTGGRVLLSQLRGPGGRTLWWNPTANTRTTLIKKVAYLADARANRLAFHTADPFEGGCSVLSKLSSPSTRIWRSCRERVAAISPDASRLATDTIIEDHPDAGVTHVRTGAGRLLATYRAEAFGRVQWETNRALLMETHGRTRAATIRCTPTACNRASKLSPSQASFRSDATGRGVHA
ncbi:hypothetical protein [Nocardioides speluncae]|uniref:hypothetical protein n=1 Tax=Nocardioides speluncae TaxID=2670337 RepID=UPI000D68A8EA|nr:hypothetical protein [Nocardioides speluncae]